MGDARYLTDAYARELETRVARASQSGVELHDTIFYPEGGGQPNDTGRLLGPEGGLWTVVGVEKVAGTIRHRLSETTWPPAETPVRAVLDWERRYTHMRYHTCLHILSGVVFRRFGSGITGGQISGDRARMDFSLPEFDANLARQLVDGINEVVGEKRPVEVRFVSRSEAQADPTLVRVAKELVPETDRLRLIDIRGFDVQADGGTHVGNTGEVGHVELLRIENKGARNKRLYLSLSPSESA